MHPDADKIKMGTKMKFHPNQMLATLIFLLLLVFSARAQECEPEWSPLGTGLDSWAYALNVFDDGAGPALFAGGFFAHAGSTPARNIARWDGTSWSQLGSGTNDWVLTLSTFDDGSGPSLYAGGRFTQAGGHPANFIARWDGSNWSPLGSGVNGEVLALSVFDDGSGPALYAAGSFRQAGGFPANYIAKWDGSSWSTLGSGVNGRATALTVFDDGTGPALYVGGFFTTARGMLVNGIAKWDGKQWSALNVGDATGVGGSSPYVLTMAVFDDGEGEGLFAGGDFITAGGTTVNRIARWNGNAWATLTGPDATGANREVRGMTVFDDGSGSALYVTGNFSTAGGITVNRTAKWDGNRWKGLSGSEGTGVSGSWSKALVVFDDGSGPALYFGGGFLSAGGILVNYVARWGNPCFTGHCPPDLNADNLLNFFDLAAFLNLFQAQDPTADWNNDTLFNFFDLASYLNAFNAGCP